MGHKALGRTLTARESLARQALGLGVLVLAVGTAYAVSRVAVADSAEHAVINRRGIPPDRERRQYVVRVLRRYDHEAARVVAQQLAAPAPPKVTRVTYAGRAVSAPMTPAPARAEELVGAPPEKKKSESP